VTLLDDPLAVWFARMRAHGELPDIHIGRSSDGRTIQWATYPHEYFDAVGAFIHTLRRHGYDTHLSARSSAAQASSRSRTPRKAQLKRWLREFNQKIDLALDDKPPWKDWNGDAPTTADSIVVEIAKHLLGPHWMADYVAKANRGGIERVLV